MDAHHRGCRPSMAFLFHASVFTAARTVALRFGSPIWIHAPRSSRFTNHSRAAGLAFLTAGSSRTVGTLDEMALTRAGGVTMHRPCLWPCSAVSAWIALAVSGKRANPDWQAGAERSPPTRNRPAHDRSADASSAQAVVRYRLRPSLTPLLTGETHVAFAVSESKRRNELETKWTKTLAFGGLKSRGVFFRGNYPDPVGLVLRLVLGSSPCAWRRRRNEPSAPCASP